MSFHLLRLTWLEFGATWPPEVISKTHAAFSSAAVEWYQIAKYGDANKWGTTEGSLTANDQICLQKAPVGPLVKALSTF